MSFEQGMEELDRLVNAMERGELTLDQSFSAYERGVKLAAELEALLNEGSARIVALKASLNGIEETDLSDEVR